MLERAVIIISLALFGLTWSATASAQTKQVMVPATSGGQIEIGSSEDRLRVRSWSTRAPVVDLIAARLPQTLIVVSPLASRIRVQKLSRFPVRLGGRLSA